MTGPELCVVIPAHNAEATLGEQLAALAEQDAAFAWEVLVCNNGSTDGTGAVARAWQNRLPKLRVVDASARRGPAAARNIGVQLTRAPQIAFCDADDVVAPTWVRAISSGLHTAALVAGRLEGDLLNSDNRASLDWTEDAFFTKGFLPQLPAVSTNNMGIRRAAFIDLGGFEEALTTAEDIDLSWRMQLSGHKVLRVPEALVHVRKRDGLRAVYRQAYSYGAGDRNLRYRYAHVIAAYAATSPSTTAEPPSPPTRQRIGRIAPSLRRISAKLIKVRGSHDLVDRARRVGIWAGHRFTWPDRSLAQVVPPDRLPQVDQGS